MVGEKPVESAQWSDVLDQKESSISIPRLPSALIRFTKFCLVGGSGVFVDMGILYLLADPSRLGLNITLSKICAAEIAMINNFIWNELWTFKQSSSPLLPLLGLRTKSRRKMEHSLAGVRADQNTDTDQTMGAEVRSRSRSGLFRRFLLFNAICGIGIGLSILLLHLFHTWLGWNLYLSNLLAILLVTCWNFGLNSILNWRGCGMASARST